MEKKKKSYNEYSNYQWNHEKLIATKVFSAEAIKINGIKGYFTIMKNMIETSKGRFFMEIIITAFFLVVDLIAVFFIFICFYF